MAANWGRANRSEIIPFLPKSIMVMSAQLCEYIKLTKLHHTLLECTVLWESSCLSNAFRSHLSLLQKDLGSKEKKERKCGSLHLDVWRKPRSSHPRASRKLRTRQICKVAALNSSKSSMLYKTLSKSREGPLYLPCNFYVTLKGHRDYNSSNDDTSLWTLKNVQNSAILEPFLVPFLSSPVLDHV